MAQRLNASAEEGALAPAKQFNAEQLNRLREAYLTPTGPDYFKLGDLLREFGVTTSTESILQSLGILFQREKLEAYPGGPNAFAKELTVAVQEVLGPLVPPEKAGLISGILKSAVKKRDAFYARDADRFAAEITDVSERVRLAIGLSYARAGVPETMHRVRNVMVRYLKHQL